MQVPDATDINEIYGAENLRSCIKMVTVAPELAGSSKLISLLRQNLRMVVSVVCTFGILFLLSVGNISSCDMSRKNLRLETCPESWTC